MTKEIKQSLAFLVAIGIVLLFTFTLADYVNGINQLKAPWLYRSDREVINDLGMKIKRLNYALSFIAQENEYLRKLVYTTKPDKWTTWVELLDECKRLEEEIEEQKKKIRILEKRLDIQLWQMLEPYRKA